jgi:hypothetical protein
LSAGGIDDTGPDGVEVNVIDKPAQVNLLMVGLHDNRLITVAEKSSPETMTAIHTPGEGVLEPFHSSDQIGNRSFHNPVIGHQYPGMDPPTGFQANFRACFTEEIRVIRTNQ